MYLLGTHALKLDEKGRVILPAKFWDEFAAGAVITRGQERCLYVFSPAVFNDALDKLREAPISNKQARGFSRVLLSGASHEQPDKQRRVTIPGPLREYAGLERDLTVIGAGTRAEIWSTSAWESYYAENEEAFANTEEEVIPGMF